MPVELHQTGTFQTLYQVRYSAAVTIQLTEYGEEHFAVLCRRPLEVGPALVDALVLDLKGRFNEKYILVITREPRLI